MVEKAFTFQVENNHKVVGIIHNPDQLLSTVGLLIIVGGPQYRIGSHRQYVHLARHCAARGIAVMRFDYQGIGDSEGNYPGFEHITQDIHHAVEEFLSQTPHIKSVAIWGLCEGASAILLGGGQHKAVSHIILANTWVRGESSLAKAYVKHYYLDRLKSPDFWKKTFSGHLNIKSALSGLFNNIKKAFAPKEKSDPVKTDQDDRPFPDKMLSGLMDYQGHVMLIQSEQDLVAREFDDLVSTHKGWKKALEGQNITRTDIAETDHTFSSEEWRRQVADVTANWLLGK